MSEQWRDRDIPLERHLIELAARAAGFPDDGGLRNYADARTMPGPIREREFKQDTGEEIADLANYCSWEIQKQWPGFLAGEPAACREYARYMDILRLTVMAWWRLLSDE